MGGAGVGAAVGANVFLREALGAIDKSELEWYVAFVDSPSQGNPWKHFPALAKGPDLDHLTLVGVEADLQQTEGMVIQKLGGEWYVLCSSGRGEIEDEDAGPATYRIYLPQSDGAGGLEFFGELRAPYLTNIPHPMVTPLARNRKTKWVMFAFDGTMYYEPILGYGTHGRSAERRVGKECRSRWSPYH